MALNSETLYSISEYSQSVAKSRSTPLFPKLRSLKIDCYINETTDTLETWDCVRVLSAGGALVANLGLLSKRLRRPGDAKGLRDAS